MKDEICPICEFNHCRAVDVLANPLMKIDGVEYLYCLCISALVKRKMKIGRNSK